MWVEADLCGGTKGRIVVQPSGVVTVQPASGFSNASCFTSPESVQFGI